MAALPVFDADESGSISADELKKILDTFENENVSGGEAVLDTLEKINKDESEFEHFIGKFMSYCILSVLNQPEAGLDVILVPQSR